MAYIDLFIYENVDKKGTKKSGETLPLRLQTPYSNGNMWLRPKPYFLENTSLPAAIKIKK